MGRVIAGKPIVEPGLTIVPIEAIRRDCLIGKSGFCVSGFKEPVAVVLVTRLDTKAFEISGIEVDTDQLAGEVPGLRELLDKLRAAR